MPSAPFFSSASVFTVDRDGTVHTGQRNSGPNDQSYDLSVIEFLDDGSFARPEQLDRTASAITKARGDNPNGAIVLLFIHGWHHNAAWDTESDSGDTHFRSFREILLHLTLREAERYLPNASGRRVIGVYVGWSGVTEGMIGRMGPLKNLSFWDRYGTAEKIGGKDPLRRTLQTIVAAAKDPLEGQRSDVESPLILIGHSMGALMLQSAFLSLLKAEGQPLLRPQAPLRDRGVTVKRSGVSYSFPDVLIALNSAADSRIAREILQELEAQKFSKTVTAGRYHYSPPMLISATSEADSATGFVWRLAQGLYYSRRTDGHDQDLYTHVFKQNGEPCSCPAAGIMDFGQDWHCLRPPYPPDMPTPEFALDLPAVKRTPHGEYHHERYVLRSVDNPATPHLAWIFQVPDDVIADHNDIFNFKSSLLILALIQISGATMSLAEDWEGNFE